MNILDLTSLSSAIIAVFVTSFKALFVIITPLIITWSFILGAYRLFSILSNYFDRKRVTMGNPTGKRGYIPTKLSSYDGMYLGLGKRQWKKGKKTLARPR